MIREQRLPYDGTEIDPDDSKRDIDKLLRSYGVTKTAWDVDYENNNVQIMFEVEIEIQGIKKTLGVMVKAPYIEKRTRIYNPKAGKVQRAVVPDWPRSMRVLYWYIKNKLVAVSTGLVSIEKEFLSQLILTGPQGRISLGEALEPIIAQDRLSSIPALTNESKPRERIIDARGRVSE